MEVCVPFKTSASQDISSYGGSLTEPFHPTRSNSRDISINDLQICFTQYLNIEGFEILTGGCNLSSKKNDIGIVVRDDGRNDPDKTKTINSASCQRFSKCPTFPSLGEPKSSVDLSLCGKKKRQDGKIADTAEVNGCAEPVDECHSQPTSPPTPMKLVSALKGSCQKHGKSSKKLSVTWAPDMYDPIPTSVSHYTSIKNQRYSKKYGKNKQKTSGKSSLAKSKDKRQTRKSSGSSTKFMKPLYDDARVVESWTTLVEYNVTNLDFDLFCGSSLSRGRT